MAFLFFFKKNIKLCKLDVDRGGDGVYNSHLAETNGLKAKTKK
jgi:hypothetical protein